MLIAAGEGLLERKGIRSDGDALDLSRESRQFLVQFLANKGHHRVKAPESVLQTGEERKRSELFFLFAATGEDGLGGLEINIA